jgi:hypothetical protein
MFLNRSTKLFRQDQTVSPATVHNRILRAICGLAVQARARKCLQGVYFGCADEVIFAQAADRMGGETHVTEVVARREIGVVVLGVGDPGHRIYEGHGFVKTLELETAVDGRSTQPGTWSMVVSASSRFIGATPPSQGLQWRSVKSHTVFICGCSICWFGGSRIFAAQIPG